MLQTPGSPKRESLDPTWAGNVQTLRFLAALWVAAFHLNLMYGSGLQGSWLNAVLEHGYAGVDLFFVISGYIMAKTSEHVPATAGGAAIFLLRRFLRIYSGWWPFFALYLLYALSTGGIVADTRLLPSFLLWPTLLPHHLVPIAWTLSFELLFYVCTAVLLVWSRHAAGRLLLAWAGVVLALNAVWLATGRYHPDNLADVDITQWFLFYPLALEFIAGFVLYGFIGRRGWSPWWPWLAGATIFCVSIAFYQRFGRFQMSGLAGFFHVSERAFLWGGFAVCIVAAAVLLENRGVTPLAWAQPLGGASYSIYLGHLLLIQLFLRIVPSGVPQPVLYALALAGVVLLLWLYHWWVERPLYRIAIRVVIPRSHRLQPE